MIHAPDGHPPGAHGTILVVEDDDDLRWSLSQVLEEEGYQVECAADGLQALDKAHARRPGLILLDLMMPNMDGLQFRAAQRRDPTLASIPTVIMTAAGGMDRYRGEIAPNPLLRKPLRVETLLAAVERYLERERPGDASANRVE